MMATRLKQFGLLLFSMLICGVHYVWRQSRRLEDGKFRPLRMPGKP